MRLPDAPVWDAVWSRAGAVTGGIDAPDRGLADPRWHRMQVALREAGLGRRVLATVELGAGRGDYSTLLAASGCAATLIDLSPQAVRAARDRFARLGLRATFIEGDIFKPSPDLLGAFDVSLSFGLVEHFRGGRRRQAVAAHARLLRPGGLAFISVPYALCLPYRLWKLYLDVRGWWPYAAEFPLTRRDLASVARSVGLAPRWMMNSGHTKAVANLLGLFHLPRPRSRPNVRPPWDRRFGMDLLLCAVKGREAAAGAKPGPPTASGPVGARS